MLNRSAGDQIGTVNYIVPVSGDSNLGEQHALGAIQVDANGNPLVATIQKNPEVIAMADRMCA